MWLPSIHQLFINLGALEMEILKKSALSTAKSKSFHDRLIKWYEEFSEEIMGSMNVNSIRCVGLNEQISFIIAAENKVYRLKKILDNSFIPKVNQSTSLVELGNKAIAFNDQCAQIEQLEKTVKLESLFQKQTFLIKLIESLECNDNVRATEAVIRCNHLTSLLETLTSVQLEIACRATDAVNDTLIKSSREIQQKVISIQTTLMNIIASERSNVLTVFKVNEVNNDHDEIVKSSTTKNLDPKLQDQEPKSITENIKSSETVTPKSSTASVESKMNNACHNQHEASMQEVKNRESKFVFVNIQPKEVTNQSEDCAKLPHADIQPTPAVTNNTVSGATAKQSEVNDRSTQTEQPVINGADLEYYFNNQKKLIEKIDYLNSTNGLQLNRPQIEIDILKEYVTFLHQLFISNDDEIKKRTEGYFLEQQQKLSKETQYKFEVLKSKRKRILF